MYFVLLVLYFQLFLDQLAGVHNEKKKKQKTKWIQLSWKPLYAHLCFSNGSESLLKNQHRHLLDRRNGAADILVMSAAPLPKQKLLEQSYVSVIREAAGATVDRSSYILVVLHCKKFIKWFLFMKLNWTYITSCVTYHICHINSVAKR